MTLEGAVSRAINGGYFLGAHEAAMLAPFVPGQDILKEQKTLRADPWAAKRWLQIVEPTLPAADRQAALREVLENGFWINAWEAKLIGLFLDVPSTVVSDDVKAIMATMPRFGQSRAFA